MTSDRSWTHRAAMAFYEWLVAREERELPQFHEICVMLPEPIDPYRLAGAIQWLGQQDMIDVVRGKSAARAATMSSGSALPGASTAPLIARSIFVNSCVSR